MNTKALLCFVSAIALGTGTRGWTQGLADLATQEKQRQARVRSSGAPAKVYSGGPAGGESAATKGGAAVPVTAPPEAARRGAGAYEKKVPPQSTVVPAGYGESAGRPERGRPEQGRADAGSNRDVNVILYVTSWCGYCKKARALLGALPNVRLVVHDIEANKAKGAEMLTKSGGEKGVPLIDVEGNIIQGFSASAITEAITSARGR